MNTLNKTVLVIDDEADLRETLVTTLEQEGFGTIFSVDGEEGLASALSNKPDLILLDIMMPKMDGITVLKNVRADTWGAHAKIIVMTASDDFAKIAEVVEAGGDDYFIKSEVPLGEIIKKVKTKLGIAVSNNHASSL